MKKNKKILLVEDEALIALDEAEVLEKNGYKVVTAYNAKKAIEKAQDESINLVLMDIDLGKGKMDGTEAAEEILEQWEIPIVFLTSHAEKEMVEKVKGITRYGYVLKNAGEFVFLESISMAFELFEAYQKEKSATDRLKEELENNKKIREDLEESKIFLDSIIDKSPLPTWISNDKGVLMRLNDASRELFGVTDDAGVVGRYDYHKDEVVIENGLVSQFDEVYTQGKTLHFTIDYDYRRVEHVDVPKATHRYLECTISPIKNSKGKVTNAIFQQKDITKQKEAENELLEFQENIQAILESTDDIIVLCNRDLEALVYNEAYKRFVKAYVGEDVYPGLNSYQFLHKEKLEEWQEVIKEVLKGKTVRREDSLILLNGENKIFDVYLTPVRKNGKITGFSEISRDITESKRIERELQISQERMEIILNSIPEDIYIVDMETYEILFMNEQMKGSFKDAKVGDICYEVFRGDSSPCSHCSNTELIEHRNDKNQIITWEGYNPINGAWYLNYDKLIPWTGGKLVRMQIAADITDRKNAENALKASEERYKNIFHNSLVSLWEEDISKIREGINTLKERGVTDFKAYFAEHPRLVKDFIKTIQIVDVNEAGITLYGANNKEELLGPLSNVFNYSDKSLAFFTEELIAIVQGIRNLEREGRGKTLDGRIMDILIKSTIPSAAEKHNNMLVAITDITAQKQSEEELKNLNEQKDTLMKELNHRVKNNLLMVSSLVSLKNAEVGEKVDLSDLENQIDAIQLIHERLNQSEDISKINVQDYIEDLVSSVFSKISGQPVKTKVTIENLYLPTKICVSLGLIINEIATNAIKHGFTGGEEAAFSVEFSRDKKKEEYRLVLSNNGNPFPEDVKFPDPKGSGLRLVSALVEQLGGTIHLKRSRHPVFTIRFPL